MIRIRKSDGTQLKIRKNGVSYIARLFKSIYKEIVALFKTRVLSDGGNFEAETNLENQLNTLGSDLFDSASLVITPNGVKTSKLYSIKPNDGTGDLSVTRATTATRINASGIREVVSANKVRIDYSNGSPAILVEPQRTNLVFPSATATTQTRAVTAQSYTLSFYGTGSVTLSGAFSGTLNGTGTNNRVTLTFTATAGNLTLTVNGSVTDWQLEAGTNATSLIPTTVGAVTRNADVISKSGVSDLIGQTEGSAYFEIDFNVIANAGFRTFFSLEGNIGSQFSAFSATTSNNGNNIQYAGIIFNLTQGIHKVVCSYSQATNQRKLYVDGVLRATSTHTNFLSTITSISLGSRINPYTSFATDRPQNGSFKSFALYKTALTDTQAIQLTTL